MGADTWNHMVRDIASVVLKQNSSLPNPLTRETWLLGQIFAQLRFVSYSKLHRKGLASMKHPEGPFKETPS